MADKKKPEAHGEGAPSDAGLWILIVVALFGVGIFGMTQLFTPQYLNLEFAFSKFSTVGGPIIDALFSAHTWYVVGIISSILSIFFISVIIFSLVRMREIQLHEKEEIAHEIAIAMAKDAEISKNENPRWRYVLGLVESDAESDWRVGIIEADSILDDLMKEKGYSGTSLGERLTSARGDAFMSLDNAWEAHTVRNRISHDGSNFPISQLEARRVIRLYETVFEEFSII